MAKQGQKQNQQHHHTTTHTHTQKIIIIMKWPVPDCLAGAWSFVLTLCCLATAQLHVVKVTQSELGKIEAVRHLTYLGD